MGDWLSMTAADLGREIGAGRIDPVALAETYLDAIKAHPMTGRIYARLTEERAMSEAIAAHDRAKAGRRRSPLDGVPISWKDLFDTAGVGTEAGSLLLEGRVPERDALVLRNATEAGLVCLGKTHMTELAFSGLGVNPSTQTPPNINDPEAAPGGSSSGAAASVAFGLAAAGIGSDTGGSVRAPAVWNDLVGLKTTSGRLSLEGVVPLIVSFDTVGPLTRSVEDAGLLLAAMEGGTAPDLRGASLRGRRFAVLKTLAMDEVEDAPGAAFAAALAKLSAAGAMIEEIETDSVTDAFSTTGPLFAGEAYGQWRDVIEANPQRMYSEILERFRGGKQFSAPDYVAARNKLHEARRAYLAATSGYDAVLLPTSPILPPNVKRLESDSDYFKRANLLALRNTRIGNLLGLSALTLPAGSPSCGIMFFGRPFEEAALLRIGAAAEAALA
ncbi:amidase [Seohaeicola zhoushanensis]|uniref:Amidase n=1 Tax=Seohaeicola zhoushanensis TaxID=1569283 RepID=A0A8J3GT95_9RHOB|nr:amidase family protein [Seohaeicola zhoushanensis]GHF34196.1 amidase [Seohaeicola zhoushanensis]